MATIQDVLNSSAPKWICGAMDKSEEIYLYAKAPTRTERVWRLEEPAVRGKTPDLCITPLVDEPPKDWTQLIWRDGRSPFKDGELVCVRNYKERCWQVRRFFKGLICYDRGSDYRYAQGGTIHWKYIIPFDPEKVGTV